MSSKMILITGSGGMGTAIAQRLARLHPDAHIILADYSPASLKAAKSTLVSSGLAENQISTFEVDVSSASSVQALANKLPGQLEIVVHTAGVSPVQSPTRKIYEVDLVGTANVIDTFAPLLKGTGGSMVCIASIAGHMPLPSPLTPEEEEFFATAPAAELLSSPKVNVERDHTFVAYMVSKRANILRAKATAARLGVRVNTISPGTIDTPMLREEMAGESGERIRGMIAASPAGRVGSAEDVARAVEFLTGPGASFVFGADLVVDGGDLARLSSSS